MSSHPLYQAEAQLCAQLRGLADWTPRPELLDRLTRHSATQSLPLRTLTHLFHPKQYKVLRVSMPFLSPVVVKYQKKVPLVRYRPAATDSAAVALWTCFPLWEYLLARPYQTTTTHVTQLHILLPQWSVDTWTEVISVLERAFRQVHDINALRAALRQIVQTETSHYPWWQDDAAIRAVHDEVRTQLNLVTVDPPPPRTTAAVPTAENMLLDPLYVAVPTWPLSAQNELLQLSRALYEHFRQRVSLAEIQFQACHCQLDRDQTKAALEALASNANSEQFPDQYERLQRHFQHRVPRPSAERLFQIWQQARGDWDVLRLV